MRSDESMFDAGAALVVGGSGGIGRVVALEFARAGADVALTYRTKKTAADETADAIRALGRKASTHELTVGEASGVEETVRQVASLHGRIHTVVYACATLTHQVLIAEVTPEQWKTAIEQDVNGFYNVVRAMLPLFREWGGGSFVNLGSAGDLRWPERDVLSVAPKAVIESLIRGIAKEEGRHGIRANTVLIGVIEAGMFLELTRQGVFDEAWGREVKKGLCLKRWGKPEEIGYAAVFLASRRAAYVTGQQIAVAGGYGI
jgi:NAD(P)-dependent dehydrogenase (short-subunit alcohol dehydrogenase family)